MDSSTGVSRYIGGTATQPSLGSTDNDLVSGVADWRVVVQICLYIRTF